MKMSETIKQTETNENPWDEVEDVKEKEAQTMTLGNALDQADDEFMNQIAEKTIDTNDISFAKQTERLSQVISEQLGVQISHSDVYKAIADTMPYHTVYESILKQLNIDSSKLSWIDTVAPIMSTKIAIWTTDKPGEFLIYPLQKVEEDWEVKTKRGKPMTVNFKW